ncbi:glycoside hydrolase domain-containing protein [Amycolatopsis rhabdoformis]|uniref:Glycoside hydrolase domain-containing protein n=1 Tax=Amycolatopsis rhabdoformis TaxID=1448059 RepID=A0ABZ1IGW1_9PSEU|nr:glycoside hydrolase domain-containing protein [Amycolatopsis rhabdoformis]WSE33706.1 glycoside hydrolase domain-containing protein [Amycolatopsis rhabdoformis]
MATWWIDYSAKKLSAAKITSTPVGPAGERPTGVIRYLDAPDRLGTKHTDPTEYRDLRAAGLGIAMYFEVGKNDPMGGFARGQEYGRRALAGANLLGFPGIVFFCADRWFDQPDFPLVTPALWRSYLDGAVSVLGRGRVGAYGFADAIDAAVGHVDCFVQCGRKSDVRDFVHGWQDNTVQPRVDGIATDRVLIRHPIPFTPAPSGFQHDEEWHMHLASGDNRSLSFDIPAGAGQIRVNCPIDFLVVHGIWQAGEGLPAGNNFDYKWSYEEDFRVDRLRPWKIKVAAGATQGSIIYSYSPGHPERTASLSFR